MPLDGYRSRPPDPPPSRRFEVDEIGWALLSMAFFAGLRVGLGLFRHEGASADVVRALEVVILTTGVAVYRIVRGHRAIE